MPFYIVLLLTLFHETCTRAASVVLVLYALELGAQPLTVGMLAAMFSVFPMLLAVQAGRLADRFGARWLLLSGMIVGAMGMLFAYFVPGLPAAFLAAVLVGLQSATCNVSLQNLAGLLSTPENRARNFSNYSLAAAAANLLGPLVAGFSIDHSSHAAACVVVASINLIPIVILVVRRGAMRGGVRKAAHASGGGIRSMLSQPGISKVLASSSLQVTGNHLYQFYMPVYAHAVGLSASVIGIVLAMNSVAAFAVRMLLPRLVARFREERVLSYAFYVGGASLLLVPLFNSAVMLGLLSFLFGLGMGISGPIVTMLMFTRSADGRSGEGVGLKIAVNHFTKIISPMLFGALGSTFGLFPMFWLNALMLGTGGLLSRPQKRTGER
jgi:MFS family permease